MRGPYRIRRLKELGQRAGCDEVVELLVGEIVAAEGFLPQALRHHEPRQQIVDRVHRARVVDVVARHQRGIQRSRPRGMQYLEQEIRLIAVPRQDAVDPEILGAGGRAQISPLRRLGIGRRLLGVGADMAKAAGHADAVGPDQILGQVIAGVVVKALRVPPLCRGFVEGRVGEQPQSDDAGRLAVIRARRDVLAARADRDAGVFRRHWRTGRAGNSGCAGRATGRNAAGRARWPW